MAFNMKLQVASVLIVAVMFALYSAHGVSCQGGEPSVEQEKSAESGPSAQANKAPGAGLPVLVVRQGGSGGKQDIWLGWLNWEGMSFMKPFAGPFIQPLQPFSQEMSGTILNMIPGASSIYSQFDQMGNQISSMNPFASMLGGSSSSSSSSSSSGQSGSPFGNLFGGR